MSIKGYYYLHQGQSYLVSDEDFKQISSQVMRGDNVDTHGRTLYPILEDPTPKEIAKGVKKVAATMIRDGNTPTVRWYWAIHEHDGDHFNCVPVGGGLCAYKMVRFFEWNDSVKKWELLPMINQADADQIKVLNSK